MCIRYVFMHIPKSESAVRVRCSCAKAPDGRHRPNALQLLGSAAKQRQSGPCEANGRPKPWNSKGMDGWMTFVSQVSKKLSIPWLDTSLQ